LSLPAPSDEDEEQQKSLSGGKGGEGANRSNAAVSPAAAKGLDAAPAARAPTPPLTTGSNVTATGGNVK